MRYDILKEEKDKILKSNLKIQEDMQSLEAIKSQLQNEQ